jgi:hypothetical protein
VDVTRALDQIAEIHQQIAKGEVYRGYRSLPMAASGLMGSPPRGCSRRRSARPTRSASSSIGPRSPSAPVRGLERDHLQLRRPRRRLGRRQTRKVVGQFLPSVVGGAAMTVCFAHLSAALVPLLPGLWAICFGMGTFASRLYLPKASGWVALFYYAAGFSLLWIARGPGPLTGWWVGGVFGVGQLLAGLVLWWNLERPEIDTN